MLPYLKSVKKVWYTEIEKHKFHQHRNLILIKVVDINEIVVSSKVSFGKKRV